MEHKTITFKLEEGDMKILDDHMVVVKALKSDLYDFSDTEESVFGFIRPEILSAAVDSYSGIPIYVDHQRTKYDKVGVVRTAYYKDNYIFALIELFSDTEEQREIIEAIQNEEITSVSSGFDVEYVMKKDNFIEIFGIEANELSLMKDYTPRCPTCSLVYKNFGSDEHVCKKELGEDVDKIPLVYAEKDGDSLSIRITPLIRELGLKEDLMTILSAACPCKEQEELGELKEFNIEVDFNIEGYEIKEDK